jgi:hypothetical protein
MYALAVLIQTKENGGCVRLSVVLNEAERRVENGERRESERSGGVYDVERRL